MKSTFGTFSCEKLFSKNDFANTLYTITNSRFCTVNVSRSPFANCQSFCISSAYAITNVPKNKISELLFFLYSVVDKTQFVIDIKSEYLNPMKTILKDFTKEFLEMNYKSTNGSNMVLCLIKMDLETSEIFISFSSFYRSSVYEVSEVSSIPSSFSCL